MKIQPIVQQIETAKENIEFMQTGIQQLDGAIDGGFIRQELIVLGGFTGLGKSYLSAQMFFNIAKQGFKSAYFSLEITNSMVVSRLIGQRADVKAIKILKGDTSVDEDKRVQGAIADLVGYHDFMDFYDDTYDFELICNTIRENKYEFVVIDFIQNIVVKNMDEYTRLSYVALELQKLAKEVDACILVLSQLSNSAARNMDSQLEYKGSGSIAMVCDLGFIINRDFELDASKLDLHLKKNRRGVSGITCELRFTGEGGLIL